MSVVTTVPGVYAVLGLILLLVLLLPLGGLVVRLGERLIGRRLACSVPERLLLSLYAASGLLIALASSPVPLFYGPIVEALLIVGFVVLPVLWAREGWGPIRSLLGYAATAPAILLSLGTLALLLFEVATAGSPPLPNAFDGATQSLFIHLLLRNHVVAWTLQPYANAGVTYPQGSSVVMALPALLWGWPVVALPAVVPLLFLSLSVPAAYCWGERWVGYGTASGVRAGLVLAAFFGVVASWPRLFVGGSYDFSISLPLVFLLLGWMVPLVERPRWTWSETLAVGMLVGTVGCISAAAGETMLLLLAVALIVMSRPRLRILAEVVPRLALLVCVVVVFALRPIVGMLAWFSYPGHVLSATGSMPYHAPAPLVPTAISYRGVTGALDPFVLWKAKLSPFPYLSLEIAILLAIGLLILATHFASKSVRVDGLSERYARWASMYAIVTFVATSFLVVAESPNAVLVGIESVSSLQEESLFLFVGFQLIAAIPILLAADYLATRTPTLPSSLSPAVPDRGSRRYPADRTRRGGLRRAAPAIAVLLLLIPFGSGLGFTLADGPGFLRTQSVQMGDATPGDLAALAWAGENLPDCSRVLVSPGSVGLFLPEYGDVQIVYPMLPTPYNLTYNVSVLALTAGVYNGSVRAALLSLDVTDVFVTGRTSATYAPLQAQPLLGSSDFSVEFSDGDAYVFAFLPGLAATGCPD